MFDPVTWAIIAVFVVLIAVVDIWLWWSRGLEATFSRQLRRLNEKHRLVSYMLAFGMGALFGHFFL